MAIRISGFTDWSISATVSFLVIMPWQLTTITRSFLAFLFRPDGGRRGDDVASGVMFGVSEVSSSVWEFDCKDIV